MAFVGSQVYNLKRKELTIRDAINKYLDLYNSNMSLIRQYAEDLFELDIQV